MWELWFGTEASHNVVIKYSEMFQAPFNKEAFFRSPSDDAPQIDPVFGVMSDRKGLGIMEKVGDTTVIKIHGSLVSKYSRWHSWFPGEVTSYEAVRDAFKIAQEAGETKVMMDFATGGGSVAGLDVTTRLIAKMRKGGMRVDGHTDSSAFSAGYWLASSARQITASPQSELGSIGTMAVIRTYANTEETMGVKFTVIKAGKFKAIGNPYEELTEEDRKYAQKNIDQANNFFLEHVAKNRGLNLKDTDKWAEGQTFYAQEALDVGLVDKLATLDDLIGSGPTAVTQSVNRRFSMVISAEKLAQIASGADPKVVLNDAEYAHYLTTLADESGGGEGGGEGDGNKPTEEGGEKPAEPPKTEASTGGDLGDKLADQLKLNGKLEAQLEAAKEQLTAANAKVEAQAKDLEHMLVMGQAAVTKLQLALGMPKQAETSVTKLLEQYNDLQSKMAARFPTSQQSQPSTTDQPQAPANFRVSASQLPNQKR